MYLAVAEYLICDRQISLKKLYLKQVCSKMVHTREQTKTLILFLSIHKHKITFCCFFYINFFFIPRKMLGELTTCKHFPWIVDYRNYCHTVLMNMIIKHLLKIIKTIIWWIIVYVLHRLREVLSTDLSCLSFYI